jgi:hypothetical protein
MNEPASVCSRCRRALGNSTAALGVQKGAWPEFPTEINLCQTCSQSFSRWYIGGAKVSSALGASAPEGGRSERRKGRRRRALIRAVTVHMVLAFLIFWALYFLLGNMIKKA